jgi:small subunit ribosomal protein S8
MSNDTIADMLTRIRNALNLKHAYVKIPHTRMTERLAIVLQNENFINEFEILKSGQFSLLVLSLRYTVTRSSMKKQSVIKGLERISKSGARVYCKNTGVPKSIKNYKGKFGVFLISTSQGILTDTQAKEQGIGGEILCYIW